MVTPFAHPSPGLAMRSYLCGSAILGLSLLVAGSDTPSPDALNAPANVRLAASISGGPTVNAVVNVTNDTTAQNETPLAVNPRNAQNFITSNNDWNYNDGCGCNTSFNSGKTWTKTLSDCVLPRI